MVVMRIAQKFPGAKPNAAFHALGRHDIAVVFKLLCKCCLNYRSIFISQLQIHIF